MQDITNIAASNGKKENQATESNSNQTPSANKSSETATPASESKPVNSTQAQSTGTSIPDDSSATDKKIESGAPQETVTGSSQNSESKSEKPSAVSDRLENGNGANSTAAEISETSGKGVAERKNELSQAVQSNSEATIAVKEDNKDSDSAAEQAKEKKLVTNGKSPFMGNGTVKPMSTAKKTSSSRPNSANNQPPPDLTLKRKSSREVCLSHLVRTWSHLLAIKHSFAAINYTCQIYVAIQKSPTWPCYEPSHISQRRR